MSTASRNAKSMRRSVNAWNKRVRPVLEKAFVDAVKRHVEYECAVGTGWFEDLIGTKPDLCIIDDVNNPLDTAR